MLGYFFFFLGGTPFFFYIYLAAKFSVLFPTNIMVFFYAMNFFLYHCSLYKKESVKR